MGKTSNKRYSPKFKFTVVLAVLKGEKSDAEVARNSRTRVRPVRPRRLRFLNRCSVGWDRLLQCRSAPPMCRPFRHGPGAVVHLRPSPLPSSTPPPVPRRADDPSSHSRTGPQAVQPRTEEPTLPERTPDAAIPSRADPTPARGPRPTPRHAHLQVPPASSFRQNRSQPKSAKQGPCVASENLMSLWPPFHSSTLGLPS